MHSLKTGSGRERVVVAKCWQIPKSWNKKDEFSFIKDVARDLLKSPGLSSLHFFLVFFLTSSLPLFLGATHAAFSKTPVTFCYARPGQWGMHGLALMEQCSRAGGGWRGTQSHDPALKHSVLSAIVESNYVGNLGCFPEGHIIWFLLITESFLEELTPRVLRPKGRRQKWVGKVLHTEWTACEVWRWSSWLRLCVN